MKKLVIGVDIGGINTAFGLVDENGDLYAESVISTKKYPYVDDYKAYVADLCDAMHAMADSLSFDYELAGIGIGAPNANYHKGTIETPANLWKFREDEPNPDESRRIFPLVEDIARCFGGVKTLMTNDANAATIGEMVYGNAKGMRDFIMVTLGTGLGSGFVANGEMIYGSDGFAGEFGHIPFFDNEIICSCGKKGCLETEVSGIAIEEKMCHLIENGRNTILKEKYDQQKSIHIDDIIAAAKNDDNLSIELIEEAGEKMGKAVAFLINTFNPETVIVGGNLAAAGDYIMLPLKSSTNKYSLNLVYKDTKFRLSKMGKTASAWGAAMLIRNQVLGLC